MIHIHQLFVGRPHTIADAKGKWRSAIGRVPMAEPVALGLRGLEGDQVADKKHHGSPDQAVCCHSLEHYDHWNAVYGLEDAEAHLGPGAVGENFTLSGATEGDICIGDVYSVGSARVQVTMPRFPCWKQERKVGLPDFLRRTFETMRTGFYLRVLAPGTVQAGDEWQQVDRPNPEMTLHLVNAGLHGPFDADLARRILATPGLADAWQAMMTSKMERAEPGGKPA